jgi:CRP-like cAMP-binding protein
MQSTEIKGYLERLALFSRLPDNKLEELSHVVKILDLIRNEIIIHPGDNPEGFYIVASGVVTLSLISPNGESRVIEIMNPGRSFAEALLFMHHPSPVQAQMTQAGKLIFVPEKPVCDLILESHEFTLSMLGGLSIRLHRLISDIEASSLCRAHQRVIGYLLGEADTVEPGTDNISLKLPATKKVIASKLDISPETFSRVLHELVDQGLIQIDGKNIDLVDRDALRRYHNMPF